MDIKEAHVQWFCNVGVDMFKFLSILSSNFLKKTKFFMAKSRRTGICLRVNTFGDSQSSYTSPNNLPPERKNLPNLD